MGPEGAAGRSAPADTDPIAPCSPKPGITLETGPFIDILLADIRLPRVNGLFSSMRINCNRGNASVD